MTDIQWPPNVTVDDAPALVDLANAGIGEGDFDEGHAVPPDLLELHEVLEWNRQALPVSDAEAYARLEVTS